MHGNTLAMPLLLVSILTFSVPRVWLASGLNSCTSQEDDHTPSGPTLDGPNTDSTIAGTLLGSSGENVVKLGTILPLSYLGLCTKAWKCHFRMEFQSSKMGKNEGKMKPRRSKPGFKVGDNS